MSPYRSSKVQTVQSSLSLYCYIISPLLLPLFSKQVETFLLMYRAHCQRILDSVVRANFHEVQDFLIHFWQGMPAHIQPILNFQETTDLVIICDFILYSVSIWNWDYIYIYNSCYLK